MARKESLGCREETQGALLSSWETGWAALEGRVCPVVLIGFSKRSPSRSQ